jgi:hypothetical protein
MDMDTDKDGEKAHHGVDGDSAEVQAQGGRGGQGGQGDQGSMATSVRTSDSDPTSNCNPNGNPNPPTLCILIHTCPSSALGPLTPSPCSTRRRRKRRRDLHHPHSAPCQR